MVTRSTSSTRRIEGRARAWLGRNLHVVVCEDNSAGRYFITGENGKPWSGWTSLGWSRSEAEDRLITWAEEEAMIDADRAEWEAEMGRAHA
jgi:hypothetical protein